MIPNYRLTSHILFLLLVFLLGSQHSLWSQVVLFTNFGGVQPNATATNSQFYLDPPLAGYYNSSADDFTVPAGDAWGIRTIRVKGNYSDPLQTGQLGPALSVNLYIFGDAGGLPNPAVFPGGAIHSEVGVPYTDLGTADFEIVWPTGGVDLAGGPTGTTYWLVVQANLAVLAGGQWSWTETTTTSGSPAAWVQERAGPLTGINGCVIPNWDTRANCLVAGSEQNLAFELLGLQLPVELVSFEGLVDGGQVFLQWTTASETNNAGFEVQHKTSQNDWESLALVEGAGTTLESQSYTYRVADMLLGPHTFRLKQFDYDGTFEYSAEVNVSIDVPGTHLLSAAYPNPFNPETRFELTLATEQQVQITVFDGVGRQVQSLHDGRLAAGSVYAFSILADGLPSGVYIYQVKGETFTESRRVLLSK